MPFFASAWVLDQPWPPLVQLLALVILTLGSCIAIYELVHRRVRALLPLFGRK